MGKFESIPKLAGMENYYEWRCQMEHLLLGEGVYNHVSSSMDPNDFIMFASKMLQPVFPDIITSSEKENIHAWIKDDGLAKSIILYKVSSMVLSLIPNDVSITTHEVWELLAGLYKWSDISLQFTICSQIADLRMKGAADVEKYIAAYMAANKCLA